MKRFTISKNSITENQEPIFLILLALSFAVVFFFSFWVFLPIGFCILILIYHYFFIVSKRVSFLIILVLSVMPALITNTKENSGTDLVFYLNSFNTLKYLPIWNLFDEFPGDPLFYLTSLLLAKLGANPRGILFFWITFIYFIPLIATHLIYNINKENKKLVLALIYLLFIGIGLSQSGQLVRQTVAGSLLFLSFSLRYAQRRGCWLVFLLATMTHVSAALFFPMLFFRKNLARSKLFYLVVILVLVAGSVDVLQYLHIFFNYSFKADLLPNIGVVKIISTMSHRYTAYHANLPGIAYYKEIYLAFLILSFSKIRFINATHIKIINKGAETISLNVMLIFVTFLIFFRGNELIYMRYLFYLTMIFSFILVINAKKSSINHLILFSLAISAPLRLMRSIMISRQQYIENDYSLLFVPVFDYLFWY
jgi:hypothetical protein